jgi:hypothetical protein
MQRTSWPFGRVSRTDSSGTFNPKEFGPTALMEHAVRSALSRMVRKNTSSRGVLVVGMHRSGTSAVARALQSLGVYLGNDFLDAQPENPTGYWEDKGIVDLNERVLRELGLAWDDVTPIPRERFEGRPIRAMRGKAERYVRRTFGSHPVWGFKDPRTIRLLPFWRTALQSFACDDAYVVVIRNPMSVAASLFARQAMGPETALRLWLVHMVPFMRDLSGKPFAVIDYDLLMHDPRAELERLSPIVGTPSDNAPTSAEIDRFAREFLDPNLRHTTFSPGDFAAQTDAARLTRAAYLLLYELAAKNEAAEAGFWPAWADVERGFAVLYASTRSSIETL